jgi:DNA-directed RNA polymerase subunit RPC12/RpoP
MRPNQMQSIQCQYCNQRIYIKLYTRKFDLNKQKKQLGINSKLFFLRLKKAITLGE